MKFIHTADIHWGMNPDSDKPWSRERAQAIKDTFVRIIGEAKERDADCLFISGDLFHSQPLVRDLKEINYLFSTIPAIHVCIIAGNHDRIRKSSALLSFSWSPNVTFFMGEEMSSVFFEDINTEVFGFSYHSAEITEIVWPGCRLPPTAGFPSSWPMEATASTCLLTGTSSWPPVFPTLLSGISTSLKFFPAAAWLTPARRSLWTKRNPGATE